MNALLKIIDGMDPQEAVDEMAAALEGLFSSLGEEARSRFLWNLMGESGGDKVSSLVHL